MAVLEGTVNEASSGESSKKMPESSKNKPKKLDQLIQLARKCAGNNKAVRDKALKSIRNMFHSAGLTEENFYIIWKGLFYSMWMSDGHLNQEHCAKNIANLLHSLSDVPAALTFFKCGLRTMINEWNGLDYFRLNKFMMFVRQLLRQAFVVLQRSGYVTEHLTLFHDVLMDTVLNPKDKKALGLVMHFTSIYLEELAKVSKGQLKQAAFDALILPCVKSMATCSDSRISSALKKNVFIYLIKQSNVALKYEEKYEAWRSMGFPGTIDQMEKEEVDEESEEEQGGGEKAGGSRKGKKAAKRKWQGNDDEEEVEEEEEPNLDPRAGRVDVELPQIKFSAKALIAMLNKHKFDQGSNSKSRKNINELISHLEKLSKGIYPFGVKKVREDYRDSVDNVKKAVSRLVKFEKKIATAGSEGLKRKKNKKKNKKEAEHNAESENIEQKHRNGEEQEEQEEESADSDGSGSGSGKRMRFEDADEETPSSSSPLQIFKRNSGVWMVTQGKGQASTSNPIVESRKRPKQKKSERPRTAKPASGYIQLFPQSEWDRPVEDGEYEIYVPSKRLRITEEGASTSTATMDVDDMAATLESSMKLTTLTPPVIKEIQRCKATSAKKVKFNTSLNTSQEVEEHEIQVHSSPAIPFDAKKKPTKTLLKKKFVNNVVNPWYRSDREEDDDD